MGIAILSGVLASLDEISAKPQETAKPDKTTSSEELPPRLPSRFLACVRRPESAEKLEKAFGSYSTDVTTLAGDNLKGVQEADIILLGCKPYMFRDILSASGIKDALAGKLLISIMAGVTSEAILEHLYGTSDAQKLEQMEGTCRVVRAMPNTASLVRESMTVIATSTPPLPQELSAVIDWMFTRIGRVVHLPPSSMDASTALCGSGPAFFALVLEAVADGAVAMGLPRAEAQMMAAQTMRGATGLVLNGEHPAILRDKVSTPGGCTIGGLLVLEEGAVRGTMARAVREATVVAAQLGKGVVGVNGTRFVESKP